MSSTPKSTRAKRSEAAISRPAETTVKNSRTACSKSLVATSKSIALDLTNQPNEMEGGSAPVGVGTAGSDSAVRRPPCATVGMSAARRTGLTHITVCRRRKPTFRIVTSTPSPRLTRIPSRHRGRRPVVTPRCVFILWCCGGVSSHVAPVSHRPLLCRRRKKLCRRVARSPRPRLVGAPQRHWSYRTLPGLRPRSRMCPARTSPVCMESRRCLML